MPAVALRNDFLSAEILPEAGGGMARLDWIADGAAVPVLRPFTFAGNAPRPNQLACFPLVPWSNRLAGGFTCGGRTFSIAPNREGDPYPIHGEGWLRPWHIEEQSATRLSLLLDRRDGAPFSYQAKMAYALSGASLELTLEVTNTGDCALPFGLGLHPWMPRSAGVTLHAPAREVWLSGADRLPDQAVPIPETWRFSEARPLPGTTVDNVFAGWNGCAEIVWPENGIAMRIEADVDYYIVYTPEGADFFCFEPVDHLINAHNHPGGPVRNGLTMLEPQQQLQRRFRFSMDRHRAPN